MKLLRELSEAAGVPGREENIRQIIQRVWTRCPSTRWVT